MMWYFIIFSLHRGLSGSILKYVRTKLPWDSIMILLFFFFFSSPPKIFFFFFLSSTSHIPAILCAFCHPLPEMTCRSSRTHAGQDHKIHNLLWGSKLLCSIVSVLFMVEVMVLLWSILAQKIFFLIFSHWKSPFLWPFYIVSFKFIVVLKD